MQGKFYPPFFTHTKWFSGKNESPRISTLYYLILGPHKKTCEGLNLNSLFPPLLLLFRILTKTGGRTLSIIPNLILWCFLVHLKIISDSIVFYALFFNPWANARAAARSFSSGLPLLIPPKSFRGPTVSHPLQQNSSTTRNPRLASFSFRAV